ncbi:MAG: phosphoenolpyruvate--protein phosphotransferase, partial [Deltaproteobacteria bacterium]|nr:phosphoenolpyruvate--protein phosphotransferase [Deltaproteobacteria bacterium]
MKKDTKEIILKGINASPGICIGKAYRVDREGVEVVEKYQIQAHDLPKEVNRFESAVKKSRDELLGILEKSPEELQHAHILETH